MDSGRLIARRLSGLVNAPFYPVGYGVEEEKDEGNL